MSKLILHKSYELQQKEVNLTDVIKNEDTSYTLTPDEGHLLNKVTVNNDLKTEPITITQNGTYLPKDYGVDAFDKVEVDCTESIIKRYIENDGKMAYSDFATMDYILMAAPYIVNGDYFAYNSYCTDNSDVYLDLSNCTTAKRFFFDFNYRKRYIVNNITVNIPICTDIKFFFGSTYNRANSGWINVKVISSNKLVGIQNSITDNGLCRSFEITDCSGVDDSLNLYRCSELHKLFLHNYGAGFSAPRVLDNRSHVIWTRDEMMEMVGMLADISKNELAAGSSIYIPTSVDDNLTDEDKETITNKGWTLKVF